jgi:hypothetical protein
LSPLPNSSILKNFFTPTISNKKNLSFALF